VTTTISPRPKASTAAVTRAWVSVMRLLIHCCDGTRPRKSFGVTAPAVSFAMRSASSSEGSSPSQIWVMRPGETPTARAKALRAMRVRSSQPESSMQVI
jgi:hypothetical protein